MSTEDEAKAPTVPASSVPAEVHKLNFQGQSTWKLLYDYDNTQGQNDVVQKRTVEVTRTSSWEKAEKGIHTEARKLEFGISVGGGVQLKAISVQNETKFSLAHNLTQSLETSYNTRKVQEFRKTDEHNFVIPAGAHMMVWIEEFSLSELGLSGEGAFSVVPAGQPPSVATRVTVEVEFSVQPANDDFIKWVPSSKDDVFDMPPGHKLLYLGRFPLVQAKHKVMIPGFVNNGVAEVAYGKDRFLVSSYEVACLKPNAEVTLIPHIVGDEPPLGALRVGTNNFPVCSASTQQDGDRPAFVNNNLAEVCFFNHRYLEKAWNWVVLSRAFPPLYEWKTIRTGDALPLNAFKAGTSYAVVRAMPLTVLNIGDQHVSYTIGYRKDNGMAVVPYKGSTFEVSTYDVLVLNTCAKVEYVENKMDMAPPAYAVSVGALDARLCRGQTLVDSMYNDLVPGMVSRDSSRKCSLCTTAGQKTIQHIQYEWVVVTYDC